MHIRLIAVDLDGTLLHDDMTISEYSRNVIRHAAEKVRIVVATGRMFDSAREKAQKLGLGIFRLSVIREPGSGWQNRADFCIKMGFRQTWQKNSGRRKAVWMAHSILCGG